jgi:hypothetical protein
MCSSHFRISMTIRLICALCCCSMVSPLTGAEPLLIVLRETGQTRNGFPVMAPHPQAAQVVKGLSRGFSGRLLRLYQYEQAYLGRLENVKPEPAYLLLSNRQGGFPRFGFYLGDDDKRTVGYVDLIESSELHGRFGCLDQIFPHELAHIIVRQLAGEAPEGGANQVHAIGVRTDPGTAFDEGYAEHCQIMAVDDPEADPSTCRLASDQSQIELAGERLARYQRELQATWAPASPMRMGFLMWFSSTEQVLRYHAVKANAFAREVTLPRGLLGQPDLYPAYLLMNVLPGQASSNLKSVPVLNSTEGVVSYFFYRLATSEALEERYRNDDFYLPFGAQRKSLSPLENLYLKVFYVFYTARPHDAVSFIEGYKAAFPDEALLLQGIAAGAFGQRSFQALPQIWLADPDFKTGTTLFDQFRGLPREHTFDLNAATLLDLLGVPGMTRSTAERILKGSPYGTLSDLRRVPGITPEILERFQAMSAHMRRLKAEAVENESVLSLNLILMPFVRRALIVFVAASLLATFLYKKLTKRRWLRAAVNGAAASLVGLLLAWLVYPGGAKYALLGPSVVFGVPAMAWQTLRHRAWRQGLGTLLGWVTASFPAAVLVHPWF